MTWMVFASQAAAQAAVATLDARLGYPNPATLTVTYAVPEEVTAGWAVARPADDALLDGITGWTAAASITRVAAPNPDGPPA